MSGVAGGVSFALIGEDESGPGPNHCADLPLLHPLEQLLADHLAQAGFDMLATPIASAPTPASVRKVWEAFCRFGACDASQVAAGLQVADHGDSLWFEPSAAREAAPNFPARPPQFLLPRRLWLITADDEFKRRPPPF